MTEWTNECDNVVRKGACTGLHCEGGVWSMLFGLLMWDCLFADIPDTLRTQFQLCPLDLSTPHFYEVKALSSETLACHIAVPGRSTLPRSFNMRARP